MTTHAGARSAPGSLNDRWHRLALNLFAFVVIAHWAEHIVQAIQVFVLGWPRPQAGGVLGLWIPWLVTSEWMHYGYAVIMLIGFFVLAPGFTGRAKKWWKTALWIQFWHHFEHLLLLVQALTGRNLLGGPVPVSILQLVLPRVELHLFYNLIVFVPMVVALYFHMRPSPQDRAEMRCTCAVGAAA
ncbi:hypothetical protein [Lentzea sp. CC55]|uniref:hypothetical protein n=1 Tax=Lentzea sp. CC55 TaxID=2884909 RepID=UPI001F276168|nr:hypothetical protein [Lentzea sp. CC55]MCG8925488.1 hypothetical protein [Lentzea sp. CC55]